MKASRRHASVVFAVMIMIFPLQMDSNIIARNSGPQLHMFVRNRTTITAERETEGRNPAREY